MGLFLPSFKNTGTVLEVSLKKVPNQNGISPQINHDGWEWMPTRPPAFITPWNLSVDVN